MVKSLVISSGHGLYVRGAEGYLDEVDEARKVVDKTAEYLKGAGVKVTVFHDNTSKNQDQNLKTICSAHNKAGQHDLDVSVHFNSTDDKALSKPIGTECFYKTQELMAKQISRKIAVAGDFINRGQKYTSNLYFLNNTAAPAVLVEVCFVNSSADSNLYRANYDDICLALAEALAGKAIDEGERPGEPEGPPEPVGDRPTVSEGDEGPHVQNVQVSLGIIPADGDFGGITEAGVKGFQAACGLTVDGVVGPKTWTALDDLDQRKRSGDLGLTNAQIDAISDIAQSSAIARYSWEDRGVAPTGYVMGMALCFALALKRLEDGDPVVEDMAQADRNNSKDSLTWYADEFKKLKMDNSKKGWATLRHLFALLIGLGMRESSGRYCESRDMSADNVSAETAEASLFQTSWNIKSCNVNIPALLDEFSDNPNGMLEQFQFDVEPKGDELANFGSGDGARYQFVSKFCPVFHVFVTALGMRYLGGENGHWGPIRTRAAELRKEADDMLKDVQTYVEDTA